MKRSECIKLLELTETKYSADLKIDFNKSDHPFIKLTKGNFIMRIYIDCVSQVKTDVQIFIAEDRYDICMNIVDLNITEILLFTIIDKYFYDKHK